MKKILTAVAIVALAFTSCKKESGVSLDRTPINISAVIEAQTSRTSFDDNNDHSGKGNFTRGDQIGIFAWRSTSGTLCQTNDLMSYGTAKTYYWDDFDASKMTFAAYYPMSADFDSAAAKVGDLAAVRFTASQAENATDKWKKDLLLSQVVEKDFYDTSEGADKSKLELVFNHAMHRVEVTVVDGAGYDLSGEKLTVTMTAKNSALVNVTTATVKNDAEATAATYYPVYNEFKAATTGEGAKPAQRRFVFLVAPQSVETGSCVVNISVVNPDKVDGGSVGYKYPIAPDMALVGGATLNGQLESGKQLNLALTLTKTAIEISSSEIEAWDESSATGTPQWEW